MRFDQYKLAEYTIETMRRLLRMRLRMTGQDNIVQQPTVFVPNHFTRFETVLLPYVIYKACGRIVHTLGMHGLFEGRSARILQSLGVLSVKHPQRNRMIIGELITGSHDWVIYAEGGLIKNKKTVEDGRLHLTHPAHTGPPHTGAAMLALKAEISRQRYLQACAAEDVIRQTFYENTYGLEGPRRVSTSGVVLQPVTITFYPIRAGDTVVSRLARRISRSMNAKLLEEIAFDSSLLFKRAEINVHFGPAVAADEYLDMPRNLARRLIARTDEQRHADMLLRRQARRFTRRVMLNVYNGTEINVDHLLAVALHQRESDSIRQEELCAVLLLAARELSTHPQLQVHSALRNGISRIVTTTAYKPFEQAMQLAIVQNIVRVNGPTIEIQRETLEREQPFDSARTMNTMQVLANEVEPISVVGRTVHRLVNLPTEQLQQRIARLLHEESLSTFHGDYERWFEPQASKPVDYGHPFQLDSTRTDIGVLLVHGYLATPRQVRPLAEFLHDQGYSVYAVRLPSHGTAPGHLNEADWTHWLDAVRQGYCLLQQKCSRVIVGGVSLGGVLSLLLAAGDGIEPAAAFAINPPFRLRDRRAALVPAMLRWRWAMSRLGLHDAADRLIASNTETPDSSYEHHPLRSVEQVRRASAACWGRLERVTAPLLMIQSDRDPVIVPRAAERALERAGSELRLLAMMPFDRHNIVNGDGNEQVFRSLNRFIIRVTGQDTQHRPQRVRQLRGGWRQRLARAGFIRTFGSSIS